MQQENARATSGTAPCARLIRLVRFGQARPDLPARTLFHAGPPYRGDPPGAVLVAAAQAAVIEGLAADIDSANELIADRVIALRPAQDAGAVVPLAQVLAPSMWCFEVGDDACKAYSPVGEGPPPALRFGSGDPICIMRSREWCTAVATALNPLLKTHTLPPESIMRQALAAGDDCHGRTAAGNEAFVSAMRGLNPKLAADIRGNAGFVLGIWMAWSAWKLGLSGGAISAASARSIVAAGGNGIDFGLRLAGQPGWRTTAASPPRGIYFQPDRAPHALGAIGDSAVIDMCGFGGQALRHAPALLDEWAGVLPTDVLTRAAQVTDPSSGLVDMDAVRASGLAPIINLAILDRAGSAAPIGRGYYCPPITLFKGESEHGSD